MNPRRNENILEPHPEPSVTCVKTHFADCFSGVNSKMATQIPADARTFRDKFRAFFQHVRQNERKKERKKH